MKRRLMFVMLAAILPLSVCADGVKVGDLYYILSGVEAYVTSDDVSAWHGLNYRADSYTIPSTITYNGLSYTVTQIGDQVFGYSRAGYSSAASKITLPETLKKIEGYSFGYCTKLVSMVIPASVETMSSSSFTGCNVLRTMIYLGKNPPSNWTATSYTYVPDISSYTSPSARINNGAVYEMISFDNNTFSYTGKAPTTTWRNNVSGYTATLSMPTLKKDVGTYIEYIPVTFTNGQETFTTEVAYRYTIHAASLTVKVEDVSKVYGDNNPEFNITYSGFINGDNESVITTKPTVTTTATTSSNVGTYPISISGGVAQNYTLKYETGTLTVTKASLELSVNDATKIYGSENPTFTLNYSGLKNNETKPSWEKHPIFSTTADKVSDVGDYKITVDCSATNYNITKKSGTLKIIPAQLTIKANDANKTYYEENPSFSYACSGFVNGDNTSSALQAQPTLSTDADQYSYAGTYEIIANGASSSNYNIVYIPGTLTINKRLLFIKVDNFERSYGEENPSFTIEYEGFVGNDSERSLSIKPTAKTSATSTSNVGTYPINVSGGDATNYKFSYTNGVLTVNKAEQSIDWNQDLSNVQVGSQIELTAVASSGLPIEYTMETNNSASLYKVGTKTYIDCIASGQFLLKAIQNGSNNYYGTPKVTNTINIVGNTIADPTLTIIQGEKGLIKTQVAKGSVYTFTIEATDGWKVHSVSFNDEDITEQLDAHNKFTTPNINASTTLNVVYETSADGICSTKVSSAKILGTSYGIKVENAKPNEVLKVYTIDGKLVKSQKLQSSEVNVDLPNNETYIINLEDIRVKVRL
jgi:hypothetical protein